MKKLVVLALATFLAIGLMACSKEPAETTETVETLPTESTIAMEATVATVETEAPVPTEPEFVSDYKPGEENARSSTKEGFCIQQGEWLYYTTDGDRYNSDHAKSVLKFQIGGSIEDVKEVLSDSDLTDNLIHCELCKDPIKDIKALHAVLGDWVYLETEDKHILRTRTDGTGTECILCSEPEELVKNAYVMFRDDYLYFTEETLKHLDASTLVSSYLLMKQDLNTGEISTLCEVDWNLQNFGRGSVVFQSDGSFYACGEHKIVEIKPNDEVNAYDLTFSLERFEDRPEGYRFMPGVERSLLFTSNGTNYHPDGLYSVSSKEIGNLPFDFTVSKVEYAPDDKEANCLWGAWESYLLAGSEDISLAEGIVDVADGYAYAAGSNNGLMYYSFVNQSVSKINNDSGNYLFWSEDEGFLYYQTSINGKFYLCRVKLDGSEWEDISWMLTVPADNN